ncbi:TetR/AcrR family transcriptional regulator [Micropruina sp.]|uniref:TetR/AcrR family transcriptional regulator n=1 Tax=Micropruina sp. TaxID=2737536 RepID=UPI0039E49A41
MARLTRDDWVAAAYQRFIDQGVDAIAVEPVAREIGATKGSFYWHFADRAALVSAVLDKWEQLQTEVLIAEVDQAEDPRAKLERLVWLVTNQTPQRGGEATLYAAAERNGVADRVARVTERRVSFIAGVLVALGLDDEEARRRAITLNASVVGYQQLVATGWDPRLDSVERMAGSLLEMALGRV